MDEKFLTMNEIERLMVSSLDSAQMKRLHIVLSHCLIDENDFPSVLAKYSNNEGLFEAFLGAKRLEGCSERSLRYYSSTLKKFLDAVGKPLSQVTTDGVREYLANYQAQGNLSNVTADNVRRVISSLFSWLEAEDLIYKSPVRRIKKIRTLKAVKPVISDESLESLRDNCATSRDLAMIDMLSSTGTGMISTSKVVNASYEAKGARNAKCTSTLVQKCTSKPISKKDETKTRHSSYRSMPHSTVLR